MNKAVILLALVFCVSVATATVFFKEDFEKGWENRWVESDNKKNEGTAGVWKWTAGKYSADENDKGIQTGEDYRFYQISSEFPDFSNKGKDLVIQFTVKHEQNIDCGGGYIKVLPAGLNQKEFNGDSDYNIMFGPDICGPSTRRVHVIFNYKGKNHLIKQTIPAKFDTYTHAYTLIVSPDQAYKVLIDNEEVAKGNLVEDWDFLPPKQIKDPKQSKPSDWVDEEEIPDPTAVKPAGWDDISEYIPDPDASKPDDWEDELDGEWEPPMIPNPEYQGEWETPTIPNPDYKGPWIHPKIDNPDYYEDNEIYAYKSNKFVGIEIWQVKAGSIFDKILITDDVELAHREAAKVSEIAKVEKEVEEKETTEREAEEAAERARLEAELGDEEEEEHGHSHDEL